MANTGHVNVRGVYKCIHININEHEWHGIVLYNLSQRFSILTSLKRGNFYVDQQSAQLSRFNIPVYENILESRQELYTLCTIRQICLKLIKLILLNINNTNFSMFMFTYEDKWSY